MIITTTCPQLQNGFFEITLIKINELQLKTRKNPGLKKFIFEKIYLKKMILEKFILKRFLFKYVDLQFCTCTIQGCCEINHPAP
jgi:hypothetical protein